MFDTVVRGGTLIRAGGVEVADIGITEGVIQVTGPALAGAKQEIDAHGLWVFPGLIDVHLHFNEPGRTEWEGSATGSRALAAGGGTVFFDMPLNSTPCLLNAREFERKKTALAVSSIADFGLWGGLVPGNSGDMPELADCGAVGFKAFLCDSGLPEFPRADDLTLLEGLSQAASLGLPVAVHAESQEITAGLTKRMMIEGRKEVRDFLNSRPVIAEVEAIERACTLALETGARLHIVHISSGRGVAAAARAKALGADISIETCPHYLFFTEDDLERIGAAAKCAPPLRSQAEQRQLWDRVLDGTLDIIASDHSPAPPEMKAGGIFEMWGGIAGVQSTLAVLLNAGYWERGLTLPRIASLIATAPASRFQIPHKGAIAAGNDADLAIVSPETSAVLKAGDLLQRHPISPYLGARFRGAVTRTIRRGETIFRDGAIRAQTRGRLVRPKRSEKALA